jgi:hypothetical protein
MVPHPPSLQDQAPRTSARHTSGLAIISLVLGIVSFLIPFIASIPAIICGHLARFRVRKSEGRLEGKGMALAGLACGYASLFLLTTIILLIISNSNKSKRNDAQEVAQEIRRGQEIHSLVIKYEADHGKFPDTLGELVVKGYVESLDDLQPTRGGNWIYFQGLSSKSSSYKYFIRSDYHKVCIYVDGSSGSRDLSYTLEPTDAPMRNHNSVQE